MKPLIVFLLSASAFAEDVSYLKMPEHAHKVPQAWGWECDHGYVQHRKTCVKVKVPKNGVLTEDGHGWDCKPGFAKYRDECNKEKK